MLGGCEQVGIATDPPLPNIAMTGAPGVYYARGDLETESAHGIERVREAVIRTFERRGCTIERNDADAGEALIEARRPAAGDNDRIIAIRLRGRGNGSTVISIRVGVSGDERVSRELKREIDAQLAASMGEA